MQTLATRFGRAALMGLAWAVVWIGAGVVLGPIYAGELEPEHIGGPLYAGFVAGTLFSAVAGLASGRRRLADLSPLRAGACGALVGAVVGMLPFVLGDQHVPGDRPLWVLPVVMTGSMSAACAVSAVVSLPIARWFSRQNESAATH
jgi:hypothetical protein